MKVYVLCFKNGAKYPYGFMGGDMAFVSKDRALKAKEDIKEHDGLYCQGNGGLQIAKVEGPEKVLWNLGLRWDENY